MILRCHLRLVIFDNLIDHENILVIFRSAFSGLPTGKGGICLTFLQYVFSTVFNHFQMPPTVGYPPAKEQMEDEEGFFTCAVSVQHKVGTFLFYLSYFFSSFLFLFFCKICLFHTFFLSLFFVFSFLHIFYIFITFLLENHTTFVQLQRHCLSHIWFQFEHFAVSPLTLSF